jgi:hypothetical protein
MKLFTSILLVMLSISSYGDDHVDMNSKILKALTKTKSVKRIKKPLKRKFKSIPVVGQAYPTLGLAMIGVTKKVKGKFVILGNDLRYEVGLKKVKIEYKIQF